ncbi:hypothetical protein LEN26_002764 [Aphanomyces euteiches]|nr:hypothetical protein LEN26_002764 [Aphanomyces euteiches]
MGKSRVSYFYHPEVGNFYYGPNHYMKLHRIKLAHHLVLSYGLWRKMDVFEPHWASAEEMKAFHATEYIDFLQKVSPTNEKSLQSEATKFSMGTENADCPVFDGIFNYCQLSAGGSLDAAYRLIHGLTDIAINWSGGLHHAKKSEASGFCYVNDIVLGILELLKYHPRVLYIDIDVHHGDGVEEAFYTTDRVMTLSFHKYGDFFPGTGGLKEIGAKDRKYYAVNCPLKSGIDNEAYMSIFKPVMDKVMETFRPGAVVLQCGYVKKYLKGHGECVRYVKSFGLPTMVLGGGGYSVRNVSRCWAYETAVCLDEQVGNDIPFNEYFEFYAPTFQLDLVPNPELDNCNSRSYLETIKTGIFENLRMLKGPPSVQIQAQGHTISEKDEDAKDPDLRIEPSKQHDAEFYSDDQDQRGRESEAPALKKLKV